VHCFHLLLYGRANLISMLQVTTEFEENWAAGKVRGWENDNQENGHVPAEHATIDLDYYSTVEELMEVGPERLKEVKFRTLYNCVSGLEFRQLS